MIPVGREDKALLESNLSARPMAGNNREHLHRQVLPFPDCFLPQSEKLMTFAFKNVRGNLGL
jgi:hypothetical protein